MNIIEKAIPHIFRNKYLQGQGGTVILGGSGGGSYSSSTGSGGASQLDDLTDVTVDYLNNEDILQFDEGSGQWKNKALIVDWSRVDNTPTTLEGYGITDAVHKSHLDDNVRHITQAERNKWNKTTTDFNTHNADEVRHVTAEDKENWNNPMIKKLKDVSLNEVKDNDILIYRDSDELWHNEQLPEYDWKKILKVNEDGEVISKFNIVVEGECFIWDEDQDTELIPISDADSYKLISSLGDELRFSCNLYIVRNISHGSSESPIIETEVNNYVGITENGDIIINSLRILEGDLTVVPPAITKEKNDYLKDALYFDSHGCLRCSRPFIGEKTVSVSGGSGDTLYARGGGGGGSVVDALDSYDIYSALSANQGRVLNEKVEEVAARPHHTHDNKDALDMITKADVNDWNSSKILESDRNHWNLAYEEFHRHDNLLTLNKITDGLLERTEVVNSLDSPWPNRPLSAAQGFYLNNMISALTTRLDELQGNQFKQIYFQISSEDNNLYFYDFLELGDYASVLITIDVTGSISETHTYVFTRPVDNPPFITEINRTNYKDYYGNVFPSYLKLGYKRSGSDISSSLGESYNPIFLRIDRDASPSIPYHIRITCMGYNYVLDEPSRKTHIHSGNVYEYEDIEISTAITFEDVQSLIAGNYYNKTEVDGLIANLNVPDADLSNYYNKEEVDSLISSIEIPETDLTNYYNKSEVYNKTEVDGLIDNINIPETDLTDYYNKSEVDGIINTIKQAGIGSNVVSFSATRYRYYKLFSISANGTINFTIQSGATGGGSYTFTISYLNSRGIIIKQHCGSGIGFSSILYKKNGDVYDIYINNDSTTTVTFISSGFNYTTYESPSYITSSSGMTSFSIKENTITTHELVATGAITSYSYYVENSDGTYSDLVSLIRSLESRIAALEGGTE